MSYDAIRAACETHLNANWSNTPVAYDNTEFEVPTTPWIRCILRPTTSENIALGSSKVDYALLILQVFTPLLEGSGLAFRYADELNALFSNTNIDGVTFYAAETQYVGDEGNGWYMMTVQAECWLQTNC